MKQRKLGLHGPKVSAIGLGAMSFAGFYGDTDEAESHACLDAAHAAGIDWLDTAELYGIGISERVIGSYLQKHPDRFHVHTKGGIVVKPERRFDNSKAYFEQALDGSLSRLGVDHIQLYYAHRREAERPVEELAETMAGFIEAGKIGGYGLSEVSPATIRRAHAVHPVTAVQSEYSLWTRLPDLGVRQTCEELGIALVAFSPLARGMFSETFPDPENFLEKDFRRGTPRFSGDDFIWNCRKIEGFRDFAHTKGWTVSATALAWCLAQGDHILPIPGTRSAAHLNEWAGASDIVLSAEDIAEIARLLPVGFAAGDRYTPQQWVGPERYC